MLIGGMTDTRSSMLLKMETGGGAASVEELAAAADHEGPLTPR